MSDALLVIALALVPLAVLPLLLLPLGRAYLRRRRRAAEARALRGRPTLVHRLVGQIEALSEAQEPARAESLCAELRDGFREALTERGVDPTVYELVLPEPGLQASVRVRRTDGKVWMLYEFEERLDELAEAS